MARAPKKQPSAMADALAFASVATRLDRDYGKFARVSGGWCICYDGVIAAGARVAHDPSMTMAVDVVQFKAALARAGEPYNLSLTAAGELMVAGPEFRASVPCLDLGRLPGAGPDPAAMAFTDAPMAALHFASQITSEKAERAVETITLLRKDSAWAMSETEILRGRFEPIEGSANAGVLVPKEFMVAAKKIKLPAVYVGFGRGTMTIWYSPDKWLRTNLHTTEYPDVEALFQKQMGQVVSGVLIYNIPAVLAYALATVNPFVVNNKVWLTPQGVATAADGTGASHTCEHGLRPGLYDYEELNRAVLHGAQLAYIPTGGVAWNGALSMGYFTGYMEWTTALQAGKMSMSEPSPVNYSGG